MAKTTKTAKKNIGAKIGVGALAAAALAMAGGYVLWERMGKQKQAKVKTWVAKARKETAQKVAVAKKMSESEYKHIVEMAVERYGGLARVNKPELQKTAAALKAEWKRIQTQAKKMAREMQKENAKSGATTKRKSVKRRKAGG